MQQMLLGIEDSLITESFHEQEYFVLVTVLAETKEETNAVCKWLEESFPSQKIANMNNQWVLLIWLESPQAYGEFLQTVGSITEERHSDTAFAVGISRVYDHLSRIRDAYLESMEVIHGKMEHTDWSFPIFAAGKNQTDHSVSIPMDSNDAGLLLNMVSRGDVETSLNFIEDILDTSQALTIAQCRYRATYLLNVLSIAQNTRKEPVFDLTMLTSQIQQMVSTVSMRSLVCNACKMVTELFSDVGEDMLISLIKNYVETHYAENIYLKTVAEATGLSYAYVSHYFSEKQGMGFADYLNLVRIGKACELLKDWKIPLKEIGETVGFGSMNTFVRNMKKFTGMTPDAYRKSNGNMIE